MVENYLNEKIQNQYKNEIEWSIDILENLFKKDIKILNLIDMRWNSRNIEWIIIFKIDDIINNKLNLINSNGEIILNYMND